MSSHEIEKKINELQEEIWEKQAELSCLYHELEEKRGE